MILEWLVINWQMKSLISKFGLVNMGKKLSEANSVYRMSSSKLILFVEKNS